jgi:AcrR family transcriptional regulator
MIEARDVRSRKRDRTRTEIVAAAWELVRRDGVAALSLRNLAELTGMRVPSLYTCFRSENDIYDAMYAQGMRRFADQLEQASAGATARETLRNRARAFVQIALEDQRRFELLFERPVPGFAPSAEHLAIGTIALRRTAVLASEADLVSQGAFDMFMATIRGLIALQIANEPDGDRWARLVDDVVDMFVANTGEPTTIGAPARRGARG